MSGLEFRFIGTGNAFAPGGLCWNGFVANRKYLFEAPPQALQSLNTLRIDANELDAVILSHHHGDHFLGLPFLVLQWKYSHRERPIRIIGPAGTKALACDIGTKVYPGLFEGGPEIEWEELAAGGTTTLGALQLEALAVEHDDRLSETLGFKAVLDGRKFGYTGDSAMCDSVLELARHGEVLISECASRADRVPVHMNLVDDMPTLRAAMAPSAHLLLTHLGKGIEADGLEKTIVAQDFENYRF
jgi:ribonuclease BN (tRNA processing enzyme)